jgi:UPF0755 protein
MIKKVAYIISFLIIILVVVSGYFVYHDVLKYHNDFKEPIIFVIEKGDSIDGISEKMVNAGFAHDLVSTKYLLKVASRTKHLQFGEYLIEPHEEFIHVVNKVLNGRVYIRKMRISSGLTNREIFKIIDGNTHLNGSYDKNSIIEGMLFADTYSYKAGESRQILVDQMVQNTTRNLWREWRSRDRITPYSSMFDGFIMASIIEKEASYFDDKKKVASVLINRLKIGQKLQSDPTVQYHIDLISGRKVKLRKSHFSLPSHHSTYYMTGLPVTAICNPSLASIKAAFHPEKTSYYYFISMPNSLHLFFSRNYKEHLRYVSRMYQIRRDLSEIDS